MSEQVVKLLLSFCYLIIIALIAGFAAFVIMNRHAKKIRTVYVRADDALKERKKYVKPVRIALISDFHIPKMPPSKDAVINSIIKASPDFVVVAGDLCESKQYWNTAAGFIGEIAGACGCRVFVVLGNHDINDACEKNSGKIKEYRKVIEGDNPDIITLVDEKYLFSCAGTDRKLLLCGVNDYRHTTPDSIKSLCRKWNAESDASGAEFVLLSHNPDSALHIPEKCFPTIMLSGHTHAGQMWMPFNMEFRFMRKDVLPREGYKYGLHLYKNKFPIYITSGVGCTFLPIRFKSTAEVAIIDI
ncbi:MAG: metallophosphoesterase [Clostridia bacterium]|nr:metallophosphoesterase [Clostridia bacterium]